MPFKNVSSRQTAVIYKSPQVNGKKAEIVIYRNKKSLIMETKGMLFLLAVHNVEIEGYLYQTISYQTVTDKPGFTLIIFNEWGFQKNSAEYKFKKIKENEKRVCVRA